jgi:hypothetical protein
MDENEIVPNTDEIGPKTILYSWTIFPHYVRIMNEYLNHFTGSDKYKKGDKDRKYLLLNGFSTLTHVFKITLNCETIELAIEHTEKAIYYYTQFIEQMEENIMHDLNVSSNNASLFVYKKTINHLRPDAHVSDSHVPSNDMLQKNVDYLLLLYRLIVDDLLKNEYDSFIPTKLINISMELCRHNSCEIIFQREMTNIMFFINHFPSTKQILYEYIYLYIKKYKQCELTLAQLCQKKIQPNYPDKLLNESVKMYIKWLLN